MTLNEYQQKSLTTELMKRPDTIKATDPSFVAKILGLVGEAGEVAEKIKKIVRDKDGLISDDDRAEIKKELGDVLWYVSVMSDYLGLELEEVACANIEKLASRKQRGTSRGSGDNR